MSNKFTSLSICWTEYFN